MAKGKKQSKIRLFYRRWHATPLSNVAHWAIFVAMSILAANKIVIAAIDL